jgi:large subunit ribosomal protein L6
VDVSVDDSNVVTVKGPKGTLTKQIHPDMTVTIEAGVVRVSRPTDDKPHRSLHGLSRSLINDMIVGVTKGFTRELEVNGVGYRVAKQGKQLTMNLGYSHPVVVEDTDTITIESPAQNRIIIHGIDKQAVGQFAADVRSKRPPEPYKGKGIKYVEEVLRHKEGKTGAVKK